MRGLRYQRLEVVQYDSSGASDWGNPSRVEVSRVTVDGRLWQTAASENPQATAQTIQLYSAHLPPGTVVDAGDEIEEGGHRYAITAPPSRPRIVTGEKRVEVTCRYVGAVG
jgi:hypothetical protein